MCPDVHYTYNSKITIKLGGNYMRFLKSPLGVTLLFALIVVVLQFTNKAEAARDIGILVLFAILTFFIHELGHVVFGVAAGYQFNFLTVGPITIERGRVRTNESWALYGGVASCSPKTDDLQKIIQQHLWFAAGGPIVSIVVAIASLILGFMMELQLVIIFGIFNAGIFAATIIPFKGTFKSDGRVIVELLSKGNDKEQFLSSILLIKEMMSPAHPTSWSSKLVEKARTAPVNEENIGNSCFLFYYDVFERGYDEASRGIDAFKMIPITKENKMMLQFVTHIKQIDTVMNGKFTVDELRQLHSMMLKFEPISYTRSEWLIAKLSNDEAQATKKLTELRKKIEQGKKQFGIYYAEERVTDLLEEKLNYKMVYNTKFIN